MIPNLRVVVAVAWIFGAVVVVATEWFERRASELGESLEAFPAAPLGEPTASSFETDDTLLAALKGVSAEAVQGLTGPGGEPFYVALRTQRAADHRSARIGRRTFPLTLRMSAADLTQYPCTSCHEGQAIVAGGTERDEGGVHDDIRPVHPQETGARCVTCHVDDDVGMLRLQSGATASIDHSYRLCAQCHFPEVEWWANGTHGKRLVGWRGRRVVMGCADCHDPHRPETEPRAPLGGVTLPGRLPRDGHD